MSQNTLFPDQWIRSRCQNFARLPALFAVVFVLAFSQLGQAQNTCPDLFQFETPLRQYESLKDRSSKARFVVQENNRTLLVVKEELQTRLQKTSSLSIVKRREAREIIKKIDRLNSNSKTFQDDLFEIMARYSILISHGYTQAIKKEYVWFNDLLERGRDKMRSSFGSEDAVRELMQEKNFRKFRDETMIGLRALYKSTNSRDEKPVFVYTLKDISISDFTLNSDSGYFFVGVTRTNGHSFDNNKNFSALTFFQHDVAHVELGQMWRHGYDGKMTEDGLALPNIEQRLLLLEKIREIYPNLDSHFTPFERRFVRISFFTFLHEYGITPSQFLYTIKKDPVEAAETVFAFLRNNKDFQRPMQKEVEELKKLEKPEKVLAPILEKLAKLLEEHS